jgi:hypothetical protein
LLITSAESYFSLSQGVVNTSGRISWDGWNITHYLSLSGCIRVLGRSNRLPAGFHGPWRLSCLDGRFAGRRELVNPKIEARNLSSLKLRQAGFEIRDSDLRTCDNSQFILSRTVRRGLGT